MRTIVFGDIHGGCKGLLQLIERIQLQENDRLIFLGDYVDGWSESAKVLDELIKLNQKYNCIFIKGNHDIWCENWLKTGNEDETWIKNDGDTTIDSYKEYSNEDKKRHLEFFQKMVSYFIDDENRLYVHAGFTSTSGPQSERRPFQLCIDRTLWETAVATGKSLTTDNIRYPKRLKLFSEIYIGHTPTTKFESLEPMNAQNVWNLDTGAAYKGKLSAIEVHSKQIWQSEPLHLLYPEEKGRN